jgi:PhzF family phenazine biosynthesis protein
MPTTTDRTTTDYLLYDVFTGEPLLGNQLAVFLDGAGLDTPLMQRIAREMNLSETTFILPPEHAGTDVRMRIFTPARELPIAGHPTIGSTFALAHAGRLARDASTCVFGLNIGPTAVDLAWGDDGLRFAWMTQPNPAFSAPRQDRDAVAAALALRPDDLAPELPVQEVSCGVPFLIVPLRDRSAVDRAVSDAGAFRRLASSGGSSLPLYVFALSDADAIGDAHDADDADVRSGRVSEPRMGDAHDADVRSGRPSGRLSTGETDVDARSGRLSEPRMGDAHDADIRSGRPSGRPIDAAEPARSAHPPASVAYARMFAPEFGIVEDPATGSAAGPLGSYLVEHRVVSVDQASQIVIDQGVAMGRASRIHVAIEGGPGAISRVKVGGEAVLVGRGELLLPHGAGGEP